MKFIARIAFFTVALFSATAALAQSWPQRPVKFILSLGPGSGADIGARLYADRLTKLWGQPVVIENRPGGDGVIAINAVIQAKDDHILLWGPTANFVGHPYSLETMSYDPKELVPVARVSGTVVTLGVPASMNVGSLKELVATAKQKKGWLNWTTAVTMTDIILEGFLKSQGIDAAQIRYKQPAEAVNDLVSERIQLYSSAYAIVRPQVQSGKVKLLAVQARHRVPGLDLPTVAELGFPGLNFEGLVGIIAARSSNLPPAARDRIGADIKTVSKDPFVAERLASTAQLNTPGDAAEFAASIDEQVKQLADSAKFLGLKPKQ
ncbi:MAG TPA: tripartite tricarboxylate transporter substrate binding protein [Burkholderiales bacterium]|jgi:tripartite-type tricarboxylate transporter receptor subunit TctC|nr:tripartite tricarboxylate transporter substrate binding protein [Burkholderiales bacterium]